MKFREKLQRFLQGRNGNDQLNRFLSWAALAVLVVSMLTSSVWGGRLSSILWSIAVAILIYSIFRTFSKNIYQRQAENGKYLVLAGRVKGWFARQKQRFADRKTYKYFSCPKCKATMRVPRHKGKVQITCKKCGERFMGNT